MQFLDQTGGLNNMATLYQHPVQRAFNTGYVVDLQRYAYDYFGSSSDQITSVRVALTLKTGVKNIMG